MILKKKSWVFQKQKKPVNNIIEEYYKPVRIGGGFYDSYIEYEIKVDESKALSFQEHLTKVRS